MSAHIPNAFVPHFEPYEIPKRVWFRRINFRIAIFVALLLAVFCAVPILWLVEISREERAHRGYVDVSLKDMSNFDMDQMNATIKDIPKKCAELDEKNVSMVGQMWNPATVGDKNLKYFQLTDSFDEHRAPIAQRFVDCNVKGQGIQYYDVHVRVWGKMHVYVRKDSNGVIMSIYHIDVTELEPIENPPDPTKPLTY